MGPWLTLTSQLLQALGSEARRELLSAEPFKKLREAGRKWKSPSRDVSHPEVILVSVSCAAVKVQPKEEAGL